MGLLLHVDRPTGIDKQILLGGDVLPMLVYMVDLNDLVVKELSTYSTTLGINKPAHMYLHIAEFFEAKREIVIIGRSMESHRSAEPYSFPSQQYALAVDSMCWRKLDAKGRAPREVFPGASCLFEEQQTMYVYSSLHEDDFVGELYMLHYRERGPVWSLVDTHGIVPRELTNSCLDLLPGGSLLLFGGYLARTESDQLYKYDVSTGVWSKGTEGGKPLGPYEFQVRGKFRRKADHTSVRTGTKIWYIGGGKSSGVALSRVLLLDVTEQS